LLRRSRRAARARRLRPDPAGALEPARNARKFTPDRGTIDVRAERHGDVVQFSVRDSGPGIRTEDSIRVFERFWQATATASLGTGLGLPIAKGIVEAHGGRIWVDSRAGIGATFHFTLPIANDRDESFVSGPAR
jgi:signal transduction histidine kinase